MGRSILWAAVLCLGHAATAWTASDPCWTQDRSLRIAEGRIYRYERQLISTQDRLVRTREWRDLQAIRLEARAAYYLSRIDQAVIDGNLRLSSFEKDPRNWGCCCRCSKYLSLRRSIERKVSSVRLSYERWREQSKYLLARYDAKVLRMSRNAQAAEAAYGNAATAVDIAKTELANCRADPLVCR